MAKRPSLEAHFRTLDFSTQLEEVRNLLNREPRTKITFWGTRVIQIDGFSGSVSLADLCSKILKISRQRSEADDLTSVERIAGVEIVNKLITFYERTDSQRKTCNVFTRFLIWIREYSLFPYTPRFYLEEDAANRFLGYSQEKFLQTFGGTFSRGTGRFLEDEHPDASGGYINDKIVAKEESVRRLLAIP